MSLTNASRQSIDIHASELTYSFRLHRWQFWLQSLLIDEWSLGTRVLKDFSGSLIACNCEAIDQINRSESVRLMLRLLFRFSSHGELVIKLEKLDWTDA